MKKLLYFSSNTCSPCRTFKPIMQQVSQNIPVDFIDTDQNSVLTVKYNIRSVPTVVLVNSGTELKRFTGVRNKQEVINFYNN